MSTLTSPRPYAPAWGWRPSTLLRQRRAAPGCPPYSEHRTSNIEPRTSKEEGEEEGGRRGAGGQASRRRPKRRWATRVSRNSGVCAPGSGGQPSGEPDSPCTSVSARALATDQPARNGGARSGDLQADVLRRAHSDSNPQSGASLSRSLLLMTRVGVAIITWAERSGGWIWLWRSPDAPQMVPRVGENRVEEGR